MNDPRFDQQDVLEATVRAFHGVRNDDYESVKRALETLAIKTGEDKHQQGHTEGFAMGIFVGAIAATALYGLLGVLL